MTLFGDLGFPDDAPGGRAGSAPGANPYASPSRLKIWRECPKKYAFSVVEKRPTKPSPHLDLGSNVHAALRDWLRLAPKERSLENLLEFYRAAWRVNRPAFARRTREELRDWGERGIAMLRAFADDVEPDLEPVAIEKSVRVELDDLVLGGRVDRVDLLPDGTLAVIDYKTGKFPANETQARAEDLAAAVYARGSSVAFAGAPVSRVEYLHLATMERLVFDLPEDAVGRAIDGLATLAREAHAAETEAALAGGGALAAAFLAKPSRACRWCDFLAHCKEGQAVVDGPRRPR
jgi:RecB family exonuclease